MKEIYKSPELELKKLLPEKKITLIEDEGLQDDTVISGSDIEVPL